MIEFGNKNKQNENKDKWNYCDHMHILPFLGDNHCLLLLHMAKRFIWIEKKRNNEFEIGYMINPNLHIIKVLRLQVDNVQILYSFYSHNLLSKTIYEKETSVLALLLFYDTRV